MSGSKPTNAELDRRINQVMKLIVNGVDRAGILQYTSEKTEWNVTDRTIDDYIAKATEIIKTYSAPLREDEMGKAMLRLTNLYARNMQINDFKAALATQKEINALLGMYAPEKKELTGKDGAPLFDSLTDDERANRITALLDAARTRRSGQSVSDGDE